MNKEYNIDKQKFIETASKWLRSHLPRVISNYPSKDPLSRETYDMLNEDMRAEFEEDMNKLL